MMDRFVQSNYQLHLELDNANARAPQVIGFESVSRNEVLLRITLDLASQHSNSVYLRANEVLKLRRILDAWLIAQGESA